jgi:Fe2+ transport system protein FeoA
MSTAKINVTAVDIQSQRKSRMDPSEPMIPLSMLAAGDSAVVQSVVGGSELVRHLAEMGFRDGALIEMVRPGATCILQVDGTKLCVRGDELLQVMVTPLPKRHSA